MKQKQWTTCMHGINVISNKMAYSHTAYKRMVALRCSVNTMQGSMRALILIEYD